jgi:predicted DNA-binding transcriptional regulator AlpA
MLVPKTRRESPATLNRVQLARYLGISYAQVIRLQRTRELPPPLRLGRNRQTRWSKARIDQWLTGEPLKAAGGAA